MSSNDKIVKVAKPFISTRTPFYVDIIIPFREQYSRVTRLLEQILRLVQYPRYRIILVDDGSKNKNFAESLTKIPHLSFIQNEKPIGFAASVNKAVNQSKTDFICVMHSDIEITQKNFLWNMAKNLSALKDQNVAAISAVTDNPMSKECIFLKRQSSTNEDPKILENDQYLPFYCILFSKPVFLKLGGFFEFPICWYEDKLIANKMISSGYKLAYDPSSWVKHIGGATITELVNKDKNVLNTIKENKTIYMREISKIGA